MGSGSERSRGNQLALTLAVEGGFHNWAPVQGTAEAARGHGTPSQSRRRGGGGAAVAAASLGSPARLPLLARSEPIASPHPLCSVVVRSRAPPQPSPIIVLSCDLSLSISRTGAHPASPPPPPRPLPLRSLCGFPPSELLLLLPSSFGAAAAADETVEGFWGLFFSLLFTSPGPLAGAQ